MIQIHKNQPPPPPPSTAGKGERYHRLDALTKQLLEVLPKVNVGDAFDVPGKFRKVAIVCGLAETRLAREGNRQRRRLKLLAIGEDLVRVHVLAPK